MAFGNGRGLGSPLLTINFILYVIAACLAGWALNRNIDASLGNGAESAVGIIDTFYTPAIHFPPTHTLCTLYDPYMCIIILCVLGGDHDQLVSEWFLAASSSMQKGIFPLSSCTSFNFGRSSLQVPLAWNSQLEEGAARGAAACRPRLQNWNANLEHNQTSTRWMSNFQSWRCSLSMERWCPCVWFY